MEASDYWQTPGAAARFIRSLGSAGGHYDLLRATEYLRFSSVLDMGAGAASVYFAMAGKQTTALRPHARLTSGLLDALGVERVNADFSTLPESRLYDGLWMADALEHTLDAGAMLRKAARLLTPNGWLMAVVPPYSPEVDLGHLSTGWNLGHLIYALLVAGFNVKYGHFVRHGGSLCGFVQKGNELVRAMPAAGDDSRGRACFTEPGLSTLWPMPVRKGFNGDLEQVNWFADFAVFLREVPAPLARMHYPAEAFQSRTALLDSGRWRNASPIVHNHFVYGPYCVLPPGSWEVRWDLSESAGTQHEHPVMVDVAVNGVAVAERRVAHGEVPVIRFTHQGGPEPVEFRVYADGRIAPGAVSFGGVSAVRKGDAGRAHSG